MSQHGRMPKKKKNALSPPRAPGQLTEYGSGIKRRAYGPEGSATHADSACHRPGFAEPWSGNKASQSREEISQSMRDMFSHLDPEIISMVLSEVDFKVDRAVDSLLELSDAAKGTPVPPPVSGFEQAAALLVNNPRTGRLGKTAGSFTIPNRSVSQSLLSPEESHLTEEIDALLDQELQTLTSQQKQPFSHSPVSYLPPPQLASLSPRPLSSQSPRPVSQSSSKQTENVYPDSGVSEASSSSSPVNELSFGGHHIPESNALSLDFSHLTLKASSTQPRPSAFHVYRRPDQPPNNSGPGHHQEALSTPAMFWNTKTARFSSPTFISPVASNPWNTNTFPASHWMTKGPIRQAPLKPSATVPTSWTLPTRHRLKLDGQILVLLRGAPGCGKTTLATAMLAQNSGGVAFSTDDFFYQNGQYHYDPHVLGEAHAWNQQRAKNAFEQGLTPIIIDNTNMQSWEMKPYVAMALKHRYKVLFREPDTWWKNKPRELERRTKHHVTMEKIKWMLDRYDRFVSIQTIMNSHLTQSAAKQPLHSTALHDLSRPDLVGVSGVGNLNPHHSASLPDVSTVSHVYSKSSAGEVGNEIFYSSQELLVPEGPVTPQSDLVDSEELDLELDACLEDTNIESHQITSETFEELVVPTPERLLESTVAFSESIAQRVKRNRAADGTAQASSIPDDLVNLEHKGQSSVQEKEAGCDGACPSEDKPNRPELLEFVGDWPLQSQEQRQGRHQKSTNDTVLECSAGEAKDDTDHGVEFQKLIDLLLGRKNTSPDCIQTPDANTLSSLRSPALSEKQDVSTIDKVLVAKLPDCVQERTCFEDTIASKDDSFSAQIGSSGEMPLEKPPPEEAEKEEEGLVSPNVLENLKVATDFESSLERRRGLNRRSGKSCKLALTFTNQSPSSHVSQSPVVSHFSSEIASTSEPLPVPMLGCLSASTQTHSQDFALLWRIDQQKCSEVDVESSSCLFVLEGNATRFIPQMHEKELNCVENVPYRVVHEKGSQIEEIDLGENCSKQQHLDILSRHFRGVSMDNLEDLYEKCHQDVDWTTNLLLDSGEKLFKDDEEKEGDVGTLIAEEESCEPGVFAHDSTLVSTISHASPTANHSSNHHAERDWNQCEPVQSECEGGARTSKGKCTDNNSQVEVTKVLLEVPTTEENQTSVSQSDQASQFLEEPTEGRSAQEESSQEEDEETKAEVRAITQLLLSQVNEMELKEQKKQGKREPSPMSIQSLVLKLPTELALQLTELFGPVGVSPGAFSSDDCAVRIDLNLAKLLHQKWKETIQDKHSQAALSYHLMQDGDIEWDGIEKLPVIDHWNASYAPVSLRDIMNEEQVMQDSAEKCRSNQDLDKKDGATRLKENQLFSMFPTMDRNFLRDTFQDHNYSLEQTEKFLKTLLNDGPVKTVVAPEVTPQWNGTHRTPSKERKWKPKDGEAVAAQFQDSEDPEYEDFRTEATLQRRQQIECFNKAAEAHRQGLKDVAFFYAQQGHMHGEKMREANHRASMEIFQRGNASLLHKNVLDLHGLHVDEALHHLSQVLSDKCLEFSQGLCPAQLSVITGRGNRSQGGVARIRPAVLDYLKTQHYSYTEPSMGLVLVTLH